MSRIMTGTVDAHSEHEPTSAAMGLMLSMGLPMLIGIWGVVQFGWSAISWPGAIVWGIVASLCFTLFSLMGKAMGMSRMDLLDLLGSMFVTPHSSASRALGFVIHHMNGALLAVGWAYGALLVGMKQDWFSALIWGIILWVLALIMLTSMGPFHPAIRRGEEEDPGMAATNFGKMTPVGSLIGHFVYGLVLGLLYQNWPLS